MKKYFILLTLLSSAINLVQSQSLVSTAMEGRNAVLEEFTGINCPNCPDGHVRAQALLDAHPGRVSWINIHAGYFASAVPDYRIPEGDSIDDFVGVNAYPSGTMNRINWPGSYNQPPFYPQNPPALAIRRPGWWDAGYPGQGAGEYIILNGGYSHVNIGAQSTFDVSTRLLTVTVELYYTINDTVSNKLNVVLAENNIIGYQSGGSNNYVHEHMLRHMITGLWGDVIPNTNTGTFISRTYTYTVPANFNIDNCELTIFVTKDDNKSTLTGVTFPAKNGSTLGMKDANIPSFTSGIFPNPISSESVLILSLVKKENVTVEILDITGRIIYTENLGEMNIGSYNYPVMPWITKAVKGIYFLRVAAGNETKTEKIFIQ